jgi:hypothetical protein
MSTLLGQQWILDADREKPATDSNALSRFADSRTGAQAGLSALLGPAYLSASQMVQANFACQSSLPPRQRGNAKLSEFCDRWLDTRIGSALAAEGNHSPNSVALWARADRTLTDQAPLVPLATPNNIDFVSSRVGNYQYIFQQAMLWDQLWVRKRGFEHEGFARTLDL